MDATDNTRPLEPGIVTDFSEKLSYGRYLALDDLLAAQHPLSSPQHHDELLFIIQHQTSELWLKLVLHELRSACELLAADELGSALKRIARVKHIQEAMTQQWSVLATLTPTEYSEFRGALGTSSGFQSYQYRAVEFLLGNKNAKMLSVFESDPAAHALLAGLLDTPSLYDEFLRYLSRQGIPVPAVILERDVTKAHTFTPELVPVFRDIYMATDRELGALRGVRRVRRPRRQLSVLAVPPHAHGRAHDRHGRRNGRVVGRRLLAARAVVDVLSRAVRGSDRNQRVSTAARRRRAVARRVAGAEHPERRR